METFLQVALSFPTLVFSVLLAVAVTYWLIAMLGLVDIEIVKLAPLPEGAEPDPGGAASLLMKYGLDGMPLTLIATGVFFFGWLISYFVDLLLLQQLASGPLRWLLSAGLLLVATLIALPITGLLLHPLAPLFAKVKPVDSDSLLGRVARVRSPDVNAQRGTADLDDGAAGLVLQIRADAGQFTRGDEVVLVEYLPTQNAYRVIARGAV